MDEIDRAQKNQAEEIQRALSTIPTLSGPSSPYCQDCGEKIPIARQKAVQGCTLCIDCKTALEKR